jgi:hypothetical protein
MLYLILIIATDYKNYFMKRRNLVIVIFPVFWVITSCKPEFVGYDCSSNDNKSTLLIDDAYYSFFEEKVRVTRIIENDMNILINYSITHYPVPAGSGNADNSIKDAIAVNIVLIKDNVNKITIDNDRSNVTFYELNNPGQIFGFSESNLFIEHYQTCDCGNELKIPEKSPNLFNAVISGKIQHDAIVKNLHFQIKFETKKMEVYER